MTNVPNDLREMWADVYKLFDRNYLMQNSEASWNEFWKQAMAIKAKYPEQDRLFKLLTIVGDMIGDRMKAEEKPPSGHPCTLEDMNLF